MNKEKIRNIKDILLVTVLSGMLIYIAANFLLPVVLPFAISFGVAVLMRRPSDFIAAKIKVSKKIVRPVISVLIIIAAISIFVFGVVRLASEAWALLVGISEDGTLAQIFDTVKNYFGNLLGRFGIPGELESGVEDAFFSLVSSLISSAAGIVTSVAAEVPKILLFLLVSAVSTVYFSVDLEQVENTVITFLPEKFRKAAVDIGKTTTATLGKYVRSYFLIMLITFAMMLFGLTVIGVRYAWLLAFIIAILDLLPVLGIGIVLIPWTLFSFMAGNTGLGIGLLILYGIATVVRQVIEPKIVGKSLGIHPLLTLVLMYIGYTLFGFFGLVLMPLSAVFFVSASKKNIPPISKSESDSSSSETQL